MYETQFADYLKLERNYSDRTVSSYLSDLELFRRFLDDTEHGLDPANADRDMIRMWVVYMMEKGESSTTVNRRLSSLRTFYRYLRGRGILESSPAASVRGPKNSKPLPQFVRESEMDEIRDGDTFGTDFIGVRNSTVIAVFYEAGLRMAELIGLDLKDVDLVSGTLKVTGKRDKQRIIPFGEELRERLARYIGLRGQTFPDAVSALFLSSKGERIPRHQVYKLVKGVLTDHSSVAKKSPHVLRHSFATSMLNHDAELGAVRELLGHESLATTQIYVHTTFQQLKDIYQQAHPRGDK